jgi:hypothetical protein
MGRWPTKSIDWLHVALIAPLIAAWANRHHIRGEYADLGRLCDSAIYAIYMGIHQ